MAIDKQLRQMSLPQEPVSYPELSHPPQPVVTPPLASYPTLAPFIPPVTQSFVGSDYGSHGSYPYQQTNNMPHPSLNIPMVSSQMTPAQAAQNNPTSANITNLFNSLVKAGIVSIPVNNEPQPSDSTVIAAKPSESKLAEDYEREIMSLHISLSTADVMK